MGQRNTRQKCLRLNPLIRTCQDSLHFAYSRLGLNSRMTFNCLRLRGFPFCGLICAYAHIHIHNFICIHNLISAKGNKHGDRLNKCSKILSTFHRQLKSRQDAKNAKKSYRFPWRAWRLSEIKWTPYWNSYLHAIGTMISYAGLLWAISGLFIDWPITQNANLSCEAAPTIRKDNLC